MERQFETYIQRVQRKRTRLDVLNAFCIFMLTKVGCGSGLVRSGPVRSELGLVPGPLRSLPGYPKSGRTQPMSLHTAVYRKCSTRARGQGQWDGVETGNTDLTDSPATRTTRQGVAVRKVRLPQRYCCCHRSQLSPCLF